MHFLRLVPTLKVEPLGPDQGNNEGRYAYKVSEKAKRYIERFGIPYGSW